MRRKVKTIHFIGIGGIGMSGIAEVLLNLGYTISGSDISRSDITDRLISLGADVYYMHAAANIGNVDVVVTSTAVKGDNPEVVEAHTRGIPIIPRAEMLAELLKMKVSVAVSGTHGKTTTTSMISTVLAHGGLDPTMVIGGKLASIGSNARLGDGDVIVAEADESDGSFLKLSPHIAVITNIEREHLDYFKDIAEIKSAFLQFANLVPFYGASILYIDDDNVKEILPDIKRRCITYGLSADADYRAQNIVFEKTGTRYELYYKGRLEGDVALKVPGLYNVCNSLATIAVARELDLSFSTIARGIQAYTGVQRRLEVKGKKEGMIVVDDYGHHPTEIRATLKAARQVWEDNRLVVIFQPHRYTRTQALFDEFLGAFDDADILIMTDIYAASENEIEGIHAKTLSEAIASHGHENVTYISDFGDIVSHLGAVTRPGDVIMTLGAGTVWKIGETFLQQTS
jgi:UDP-N-acetylmuramate--alanine ligase